MPSTYSPQDALNLCSSMIHGVPVLAVQSAACDMINSQIHVYYPWQWSVKSLTPITLLQGVQDYAPIDTDVLRPLKMRIVRTDVIPNEFRELDILGNLAPEISWLGGLDSIRAVGFYPGINKFRLDLGANIGSGQVLQLQGEYQQLPTKITDVNLTSVFSFPDHYFNVFVSGLLWKLYQLADDARAGNMQADRRGNVTYTGQLGAFVQELSLMARTEDLRMGDEFQFPSRALGVRTHTLPGIFGLT